MTKFNKDDEEENLTNDHDEDADYPRQKEKIRNLQKKSEYKKRQKAIARRKKILEFLKKNFKRTKEFTIKTVVKCSELIDYLVTFNFIRSILQLLRL